MSKNKITLKKGMTKKERDDQFSTFITNQILDMMKQEKGSSSHWSKKWKFSEGLPYRVSTANKETYKGFNIMNLSHAKLSNNYNSNAWGTSKAWKKLGFKLAEDQHWSLNSETVVFSSAKKVAKKDNEGNIIKDSQGNELFFSNWFHTVSAVYNASQMVNIETGQRADQDDNYRIIPIEKNDQFKQDQFSKFENFANNYLNNQELEVRSGGNRAFYNISQDFIGMPSKDNFQKINDREKEENYYSTLFHEIGHSTGNPTRLNRKFGNRFGDNNYAFEELIAELTSVLIGAETGLELTPALNHACYLNSWLEALSPLKGDTKYVWKALNKATQATRFITDSVEAQENKQERHIFKKSA